MEVTTERFLALFLGIIVKVGLMCLVEHVYYTQVARYGHLIAAAVRVQKDDLHPSTDGSFVIVSGSRIRYDPLWLDEFGFSLNAAAVCPHLEFCQWFCSNFNYSTGQCDGHYMRIWSSHYSLHLEYDFFHQNPILLNVPDVSYLYTQEFKIGAYKVTPGLASTGDRTRLPMLPAEAATNFSSSRLSKGGWRSVGRGWLYHSYSGFLVPSFPEETTFWPSVGAAFLESMCEAGSMRIQLETFDAPVVTALGFRTGNVLGRAVFEGAETGLIAEGKKTMTEILQPSIDSLRLWTWVIRIVAIVLVFVVNLMFVPIEPLRAPLISGEILLGIAVWCWQWSGPIAVAIFAFAGAACITTGLTEILRRRAVKRW
jgi:hypothetical protein